MTNDDPVIKHTADVDDVISELIGAKVALISGKLTIADVLAICGEKLTKLLRGTEEAAFELTQLVMKLYKAGLGWDIWVDMLGNDSSELSSSSLSFSSSFFVKGLGDRPVK